MPGRTISVREVLHYRIHPVTKADMHIVCLHYLQSAIDDHKVSLSYTSDLVTTEISAGKTAQATAVNHTITDLLPTSFQ